MVITPICIVWVVAFTHDTRATVPVVPSMDIGEICQRIDAEHPLRKRSTCAALLGGCQETPARRPRIAVLLRAPEPTHPAKDGADAGPGISVPGFERPRSSRSGDLPLKTDAAETTCA